MRRHQPGPPVTPRRRRRRLPAVQLFEEHNTSATIRRYLDELKVPYK